ncbi:MAG: hypothetical protein N4A49_09335 [Marinifilaceae bacterium]|jgi:hypothetical protein|nr:hypothetical protein [Marinifilaceae bacterium]
MPKAFFKTLKKIPRNYILLITVLIIFIIFELVNVSAQRDWKQLYRYDKKEAFDTYIFQNLLSQDLFPDNEISFKKLNKLDEFTNAFNYIYIANSFYPSDSLVNQIKTQAEKGSYFLISYRNGAENLEKILQYTKRFNYLISEKIRPHNDEINNESYSLKYSPSAFSLDVSDSISFNIDTLFTNQDNNAKVIKYNIGKGAIIIASEPSFFANCEIIRDDNYKYSSLLTSYLPDNEVIYDYYFSEKESVKYQSLLYFIISNKELKLALYLLIIYLFIRFIFGFKRKQAIIPIIAKKRNLNLDFVLSMSTIYYLHASRYEVIMKKYSYFVNHIYQKTNKNFKTQNFEYFSDLTEIDINIFVEIYDKFNDLSSDGEISENQFIYLFKLLRKVKKAL